MQRLVNRTAEYYWQEVEFQSMVYDRTTFILANTFADGPFPSGITFKGDFSIVNDSFNHLNMTLNKVELNFETFSGRKPKFSKQYWRYIFDHGEATLRTLRIIKYQIEDFIIPNYLGAALTQEVRPLTEFKVVGCEVKEVKERAFKNFTQLEVLDLSDNHLTTLPENVFSRNINLQKILLANNQISFLTKTIFDGLPNLLLINLRKNKLTAVPAIPRHTNRRFQPMVYLMADNSIHCRCSLIWVLHELTFHHNLEIEATCSDPTMVRGMPIIEGFTRMDKEACYRVLNARKDDEPEDKVAVAAAAAIEGPSQRIEANNAPGSAPLVVVDPTQATKQDNVDQKVAVAESPVESKSLIGGGGVVSLSGSGSGHTSDVASIAPAPEAASSLTSASDSAKPFGSPTHPEIPTTINHESQVAPVSAGVASEHQPGASLPQVNSLSNLISSATAAAPSPVPSPVAPVAPVAPIAQAASGTPVAPPQPHPSPAI